MRRRCALGRLLGGVLAGSVGPAWSGDSPFSVFVGGLAQPRGLLFEPDGSLLVAEQQGGTIARIGVDGKVVRIARGFGSPHDIARDAAGNLYIADTSADRVARIAPTGQVTTYIEDLESPVDLDFAPNGELWVCELTGKVRAFASPRQSRTVVQLAGPHGLAFAASGETFINDWRGNRVVRFGADGTLRTVAELAGPVGLTLGPAGQLYVAQPQAHRLSKILPNGTLRTIATDLEEPRDPMFDRAGDLFVAETLGRRVLRFKGAP